MPIQNKLADHLHLDDSIYTFCMPLTTRKSTGLSIAFNCRKKRNTSACESCKMQRVKWLACNGLQHVSPLTVDHHWPRSLVPGQAHRGSFATLWEGRSQRCMAAGKRSGKLADLAVRQHFGKINTYQTYQRISQLVLGESALIPHPRDMQVLCQCFSFPHLPTNTHWQCGLWSHPRIPFHSEPARSTSASLNTKGRSMKCVGSSVASDLLARLQIRRLKHMSRFHSTEE